MNITILGVLRIDSTDYVFTVLVSIFIKQQMKPITITFVKELHLFRRAFGTACRAPSTNAKLACLPN